ncbi:TPA: hypothetical protein DCY43_01470, partial [candidate division WWE3 bacterium]|nr:hypothetical protein [candidate division WWE3 bacterium]
MGGNSKAEVRFGSDKFAISAPSHSSFTTSEALVSSGTLVGANTGVAVETVRNTVVGVAVAGATAVEVAGTTLVAVATGALVGKVVGVVVAGWD